MTTDKLNELLNTYHIPQISIDFYKNNYICVSSKQLDSARYLIITLTENGIPRKLTNERALFRAGKPDNTYIYNEDECIILEDGRLLIELTEQTLAVNGRIEADIQLICTNNKIYSTKKFYIEAASLPYDESAVESSNEFNALNKLVSEENERIETLKELEKTVTTNETLRQDSENIRETNEINRIAAEEEREHNTTNAVLNANSATANAVQAATSALSATADAIQATANADQSTQTANTVIEEMRSLIADDNILHTNALGVPNGIATLDEEGFLSKSQIPDRTIEIIYGELLDDGTFLNTDGLEITGGINKQYIDTKKGIPYIWSGSEFLSTGSSLGLGFTSSTAFPGDRGLALESFHNNLTADKIKYNNTGTALLSANVQEAITELTANATTVTNGLMTATMVKKLNGIANGANAYILPTASSITLGGVKTTSTVTSTSGLTPVPIIDGVPYYKDTTYTLSNLGLTATAKELNYCNGVTANIQSQLNGKATIVHDHNEVSNIVISKPIYSNATGTIIDFCQENIDTMVSVKITGNGYEGHDPIDCIYQFYNHSSGIIAYSGIANGSPLTLKVFRHGGRCKGWVVQSRMYQTLQIAVTIGFGGSGKPTFTTGTMPTSGVTNLTEIVPKTSYHTGRKPTYTEIGAAPLNHASTGTGHGIGNAKNYGHVRLSDNYVNAVGSAEDGVGISQQAVHVLATDLVKRISNVSSGSSASIENLKTEIDRALMGYVNTSGGSVNGLLTLAGGLEIVAGAVNIASVIRTANNKGVYGATTGGTDVNLAKVSSVNDIQIGASGYNTYIYGPSGKSLSITNDRFIPGTDDGLYCGDSSHRWKRFYAVNGTINTSDRNYKKDIQPIPEKFEQMFLKLKPTIFKFLDGDRDHIGAISQDVWETMKELGIKDTEFAGFCRDMKMKDIIDPDTEEVTGQEPVLDADGNPEYIYSLCYQEFIFLIAHMVQKLWGKQEKENEMMRSELNEVKTEIAELKSLLKSRT